MKIALSKYSEQNVKHILSLRSEVQDVFLEFLWRIAMAGIYIRITSSHRTKEEQKKLYAQGRTKPGSKVTWVQYPYSWHNHGLAIDIAPLSRISTLWYRLWYKDHPYSIIEKIAEELEIDHPWNFDKPHFHYSGGLTLNEIIAGKEIKVKKFNPSNKPRVLQRAIKRLLS